MLIRALSHTFCRHSTSQVRGALCNCPNLHFGVVPSSGLVRRFNNGHAIDRRCFIRIVISRYQVHRRSYLTNRYLNSRRDGSKLRISFASNQSTFVVRRNGYRASNDSWFLGRQRTKRNCHVRLFLFTSCFRNLVGARNFRRVFQDPFPTNGNAINGCKHLVSCVVVLCLVGRAVRFLRKSVGRLCSPTTFNGRMVCVTNRRPQEEVSRGSSSFSSCLTLNNRDLIVVCRLFRRVKSDTVGGVCFRSFTSCPYDCFRKDDR